MYSRPINAKTYKKRLNTQKTKTTSKDEKEIRT